MYVYRYCVYPAILESKSTKNCQIVSPYTGGIQDFKLGGAHLKKLRRAEGGAKMFGVFRVKNHDFTPKNHIFSNFRGCAPPLPPGSAPAYTYFFLLLYMNQVLEMLY
jgi:hypothetical protein